MNHQKPYLYWIKCINKWSDLCFTSEITPQLCTLGGRSGWPGQKPQWEKWALLNSVCFSQLHPKGKEWMILGKTLMGGMVSTQSWAALVWSRLKQELLLSRSYLSREDFAQGLLISFNHFFILELEVLSNLWQEVALSNNMWFLTWQCKVCFHRVTHSFSILLFYDFSYHC